MSQSAKVAVTIPADIFRKVEKLRRELRTTRSGVVQRALVLLLKESEKEERIRAYIDGYVRHPETDEEIRAAEASANELLAEVPWE